MSASSPPSREWLLLLAACSCAPSHEKLNCTHDQQPIDWHELFALAERHGVLPLLYEALRGAENRVPADALHALSLSYQTNLHKTMLLSRELIRIVDCLTTLGIPVMPYKGLALAEMVYGDIAARQAGDLDLLIRADDLQRSQNVMAELGYTSHASFSDDEQKEYVKSGYEFSFDGAAGPNLVELQWAFQPRFYAVDFDMNDTFDRALTVTVAGRPMKTPSPADLLLTLSVHAAKHLWERLIWICDIARLMQLPNLDWSGIGLQSRDLGISRILWMTMRLAERFFGVCVPPAALASVPGDDRALAITDAIEQHIQSGTKFDTESLAYFRWMLRLRERPQDRWRFLTRLALTPGPSEWNAIRLRRPSSPLYRLVRVSRLAARFVRV